MKRLAAVLAALLFPAATAHAETQTITMPGKSFSPAHATLVAGDTVVFRNTDLTPHDVLVGSALASGPLERLAAWAQPLGVPGAYPYLCTLHPFMRGSLDVVAATLTAAPGPVLAGEPVALSGRAPAGTSQLTLERSTPAGAWTAVAAVAPAPDGTFRAVAPAIAGAAYRVASAAGASRAVTPEVTAGVELHLDVRRGRFVGVHAMPAPAGLTATLEVYSPWRYAWRAVRGKRLDAHGGARFRVRASPLALVRVALSRGRKGPALVRSHAVALGSGRAARDPDTMGPHPIGSPAGPTEGHAGPH